MNKPKTILICGGSKDVFKDIEAAKQIIEFDAILAINNILAELPHVDYFASMHPMKVPVWLDERRVRGYPDPKSFWTCKKKPQPLSIRFETIPNTLGGSAMVAVHVARYLGYDKKILAGCPMQPEQAHYHNKKPWNDFIHYKKVWETDARVRHDVRSMSGWTREHLGAPTEDWLNY